MRHVAKAPANDGFKFPQGYKRFHVEQFNAARLKQRSDVARTVIGRDRKSTRLNSSHTVISYAVFCLKKKKDKVQQRPIHYDPEPHTFTQRLVHDYT